MVVKESDYSFCSVVGKTDVGCRRSVNEDSIGKSDTQNGLAVVICDGMGGNVGGKIASETAVEAILMHLREHLYSDPKEAISNAIQDANRAILKKTALRPELTGMGCTCVLLLVGKSGAVNIGHVGDSRIYLIRDGLANQLTKDQSYVQMLVDEGKLTPQEAEHHPRNNEITNAVGMVNMTPPVIREQSINPVAGDCFLLCSDGLSKLVPEGDIVKIISARSFSTDKRAEMLINAAKNNGGSDNISVQLVEFSVSPAEVRMAKDKKRLSILSASLVLAIILLLLGLFTFKGCDNNKKVEGDNRGTSVDSAEKQDDDRKNLNSNSLINIPDNIPSTSDSENPSKMNANKREKDKENVTHDVAQVAKNDYPSDSSSKHNSEEYENHFCGVAIIFSADKDTLKVSPPQGSSKRVKKNILKYTEQCCKRARSDYRDRCIDVRETPDGGLLIIKTNAVPSWDGYSILINECVSGEQDPQVMPDKFFIKIVFE